MEFDAVAAVGRSDAALCCC